MEELLIRIEAATGPERALDTDIFAELGLGKDWMRTSREVQKVWSERYTASIDRAVTLVPKGCDLFVTAIRRQEGRFSAGIFPTDDPYCEYGEAATPALAICAAALRARDAS